MGIGGIVSLKDYEDLSGRSGFFGISSREEVEEINKALTAGYQSPRTDGGNTLRVESLEQTMRILTWSEQHMKLLRAIGKRPAYSTSEEYNLQTSYGGRGGSFVGEAELPAAQDASYLRRVALVKFQGTVREVSHIATLVKPAHGPLVAMETKNGALWLMSRTEDALFFGRSDVIPQAFDGFQKQVSDDSIAGKKNVFDMRGGFITPDKVEEAANIVIEGFGVPGEFYLATRAQSDLGKQYLPKERTAPGTAGRVGQVVTEIETTAGVIPLKSSLFVRSGRVDDIKTPPTGPTASRAPSAPTLAAAANVGPITGSQFAAADIGTFRFKVTAINRFGESAPSAEQSAAIVSAADAITLTITDGGGTDAATGYRVYRTVVGGVANSELFMYDVPRAPGAATTVWQDLDAYLPGTSTSFLLQNNLQACSWAQLAPMMKIPLATLGPSIRWMQLLYGVLIVYAPRKHVIFTNVYDGPLS